MESGRSLGDPSPSMKQFLAEVAKLFYVCSDFRRPEGGRRVVCEFRFIPATYSDK